MNDVKIDINVAQGIVEILGKLQLDYANSSARNQMVEHVVERMKQAVAETDAENKEAE